MKETFDYLNVEIENEIKLKVNSMGEKQFTYIFAKNGTGKTTYTRNIKQNEEVITKIFNVDYIKKNIYIENTSNKEKRENKRNDNIESNSFNVLIGNGINEIVETLNRLNENKIEIESELKDLINEGFIDEINEFKPTIPTINNIINNIELYKKIVKEDLKTNLINNINVLKNILTYNEYIEKLNEIIDKINIIHEYSKEYNEIVENVYVGEDRKIIDIHKIAAKIEGEWIFAGNKVNQNEVFEWFKTIDNLKSQKSVLIDAEVAKVKILFNTISDKATYKLFKEYYHDINNIITIEEIVNSYPDNLDINETKKIKLKNFEFKLELYNQEEKLANVNNYIETNIFRLFKKYNKKLFLDLIEIRKKITEQEKKKTDLTKELDYKTASYINKYLKHFSVNDIQVEIKSKKKAGTSGQLSISLKKERKISDLSEGEISIFAMSYFLADLNLNLEYLDNPIAIIIDDPFDSNDHTKIYKFKNIPFIFKGNELKGFGELGKELDSNGLDSKFIILTHNIQVIYSMISNLQDGNSRSFNMVKFFENIEIREWIKRNNNIFDGIIIPRAFFPNDAVIFSNLLKYLDYMIKKEEDHFKIKLIAFLLLRLSENIKIDKNNPDIDVDSKWRYHFKSILQNELWNNYTKYKPLSQKTIVENFEAVLSPKTFKDKRKFIEEIASKIEKDNIDKIWGVEINEENHFDFDSESDFDSDEWEILQKYLERFNDYINEAYELKEPEIFRRLRHKEYLFSTIIAFALEEF